MKRNEHWTAGCSVNQTWMHGAFYFFVDQMLPYVYTNGPNFCSVICSAFCEYNVVFAPFM